MATLFRTTDGVTETRKHEKLRPWDLGHGPWDPEDVTKEGFVLFESVVKVMAKRAQRADCCFYIKSISPNMDYEGGKVKSIADTGVELTSGTTGEVAWGNIDRCDWVR
jgi:hypothetical protein